MSERPYNPLDKLNLAKSIEAEVLSRGVRQLATTEKIFGAGVYVIYYRGDFTAYDPLSAANSHGWLKPIYVGKAIPKGGRKGGIRADVAATGTALSSRIRKHEQSIRAVKSLNIDHFVFRHIVLDDIWIPLGENVLIETFKPLWNTAIDGFGINAPGKGRLNQKRSAWDVVHPGRTYTDGLTGGSADVADVLGRIEDFFAGRPLRSLPLQLQTAESADAEEGEE